MVLVERFFDCLFQRRVRRGRREEEKSRFLARPGGLGMTNSGDGAVLDATGSNTTGMGAWVTGNFFGGSGSISVRNMDFAVWSTGRQRDWIIFWRGGIRVHDSCGSTGSAQESADLAAGACQGLDEGALVAGFAFATADFVSWRIPFWRNADAGVDVAADHHRGQRSLWRGAATLHSAQNDGGRAVGDDLRRDCQRTPVVGSGGQSQCGNALWKVSVEKRNPRRAGWLGRDAASRWVYGVAANCGERRAAANFGGGQCGSERCGGSGSGDFIVG